MRNGISIVHAQAIKQIEFVLIAVARYSFLHYYCSKRGAAASNHSIADAFNQFY